MVAPRDGSELSSSTEPVTFEGMTHAAGAVVHLAVFNRDTERWDDLATVTSEQEALVDAVGTSWYHWGKHIAAIPDRRAYWASGGIDRHQMLAQLRAYDDRVPTGYGTFDVEADACIQANQTGGGLAILQTCASSHTATAVISAPCGTEGLPSCDGWCDAGLVSDYANRCLPCGAKDQLCCDTHTVGATGACGKSLTCSLSEKTCRSGAGVNLPGLSVQACTQASGCIPPIYDGDTSKCTLDHTDTKCWVVVNMCKDVSICGWNFDSWMPVTTDSGWHACGPCFGLPF